MFRYKTTKQVYELWKGANSHSQRNILCFSCSKIRVLLCLCTKFTNNSCAHCSRNILGGSLVQQTPDFLKEKITKSGPLTVSMGPACLGWSVVSRSTTIRGTSKQGSFLRQSVWSMCLDLHHVWPASTEGYTNTRQTIMRNKYRQASSHHHVTWICTLTAVRNFLSLTPTPPHPHIHLSKMTPLPTRKGPGS